MKIDVLTLFPDMFEAVLGDSVLGRARKNGFLELSFVNIRDYTLDKHGRVDDYPYGAGGGMVMAAEPVYRAYMSICEGLSYKPYVIYMSPQGKVFSQQTARELAQKEHIIILCGHYEGIDQRVIDEIVDEELSVGDYVLTGGELPACIVADAVCRLIDGVLPLPECYENESFENGLLEYPQYTRPPVWRDREVPEVLLSGHHANIEKWRRAQSEELTAQRRPDLMEEAEE